MMMENRMIDDDEGARKMAADLIESEGGELKLAMTTTKATTRYITVTMSTTRGAG